MVSTRWILALLLLLCTVQQARLILRAPLPASDAVEFVGVAQRMQTDGLAAAIRRETVPPLFPAVICVVYSALTRVGLLDVAAWDRAAQFAAALGLITAVVPMFLLARSLVGRNSAVAAVILFCLLPASSRLGADGIADAWHLAFAAASVWALVVASRATGRTAILWSLAAGASVGLALLCRAEALVIVAAVGLASILALQAQWRAAAAFACGAIVCLAPYAASGVVEPGAIAERLRGGGTATTERPLNAAAGDAAELSDAAPLMHAGRPLELGRKDRSRTSRAQDFAAASWLYLREFLQACGYIALPPAVVGALARRRRASRASARLLMFILAIFAILSFTFVVRQGYVTSRHFLLPLVILLPYAGLGLSTIAQTLRRRTATLCRGLHPVPPVARGLTFALACACLLATLRPLHYTHAAHRSAADWLSSEAAEPGAVLDQFGWTALTTGRPTYRFDVAETALTSERLRYVVVERIDLEAQTRRGESLRALLGPAERAAACFADVRGHTDHDVLVFHRTPSDAVALRASQRRDFDSDPTLQLSARRNSSHAR